MPELFDPYHKWLGIPPDEQPPNHYRLLGIAPFESDPEVIAHAADQRMAHLKSFQTGRHSAFSQRLLNEVAAAKVALLHPVQRAAYEAQVRADEGGRLAGSPDSPGHRRIWRVLAAVAAVGVVCVAGVTLRSLRGGSQLAVTAPESRPPARAGDVRIAKALRQGQREMALDAHRLAPHDPAPTAALPAGSPSPDSDEVRDLDPHGPSHPTGVLSGPTDAPKGGLPREAVSGTPASTGTRRPDPSSNSKDLRESRKAEGGDPIYLDDLQEVDCRVDCGTLGKRGATGYLAQELDYGKDALFQGEVCRHALSVHPPSEEMSYVTYNLARQYRTFRFMAAILEVGESNAEAVGADSLFMGRPLTPLVFKVYADGVLVWQSRALARSGDWQEGKVCVEGVNLLELQVHCPGTNAFAWAAWIDPQLSR